MDWSSVLDHLEGEVIAAEQTMADGRAEEIAAWGRRTDDCDPAVVAGPRARRPPRARDAAAAAPARRRRGLIERITQSQKQRDVAARMSYGPSRPVASYIDRAL